jgi:hypothetical protein
LHFRTPASDDPAASARAHLLQNDLGLALDRRIDDDLAGGGIERAGRKRKPCRPRGGRVSAFQRSR